MLNGELESIVCDYYGTDIATAMNKQVHTRKATETRYFIWFFLRYYHKIPTIVLSEVYGFSKRSVSYGLSFIRSAISYQREFHKKMSDLTSLLGYPETRPKERTRMYVRRETLI